MRAIRTLCLGTVQSGDHVTVSTRIFIALYNAEPRTEATIVCASLNNSLRTAHVVSSHGCSRSVEISTHEAGLHEGRRGNAGRGRSPDQRWRTWPLLLHQNRCPQSSPVIVRVADASRDERSASIVTVRAVAVIVLSTLVTATSSS